MKLNALACFTFVILFASFAAAQQSPSLLSPARIGAGSNVDWAQFNFDSAHDGYNPYETILSPANVGNLMLKWSYSSSEGEVEGPPLVANGKVYFGVENPGHRVGTAEQVDFALYALDAATGAFIWKVPNLVVFKSPAVANGLIYVSSSDGLLALDANTGALVWQSAMQCCYSPAVVDGVLYVYSLGPFAGIYALNAQTGALIWRHLTDETVNSAPTVANGVVYYNSGSGTVDALNADTGALLWEKPLGASLTVPYGLGANDLGQAVANGVLYVAVKTRGSRGLSNSKLYALDAKTGAIIWVQPLNLSLLGTPAVANGIVYVTAYSGPDRVLAFNASTGAPVWEYDYIDEFGISVAPSPIVANGVVYVGSWKHLGTGVGSYTISALDAGKGTLLWNHTGGFSGYIYIPAPVVVNGMIYGSINTPVDGFGAFGLPNQ